MKEKRFAILIDAENISAKYIEYILDEISNYGTATYRRVYADWTKINSPLWKEVLLKKSLTPIQQYAYTTGKNSTDSALIIDAMDILYSNNVEGFCIVSSDSDFTRLASRLRESGMIVIGMGEEKTPEPFVHACSQFKYLNILIDKNKIEKPLEHNRSLHLNIKEREKDKNATSIPILKKAIFKIINENSDNHFEINMGELGSRLTKKYPDFDLKNYGYKKLSKLLEDIGELKVKGQKVYLKEESGKKQEVISNIKLKNRIIKIINDNHGEVELGNIHKKLSEGLGKDYMKGSIYSKPGKFFKSLDFVEIKNFDNNTKTVVLKNKLEVKKKSI